MVRQQKQFSEINITPLTDIFLVLLIIMMVVAPMLNTNGLRVQVPSLEASPDMKTQPSLLQVNILPNDSFVVNEQPIPSANLTAAIQQVAKRFPDGVQIQAHPNASHRALTLAMDAVQGAGVTKLAVTELAE